MLMDGHFHVIRNYHCFLVFINQQGCCKASIPSYAQIVGTSFNLVIQGIEDL